MKQQTDCQSEINDLKYKKQHQPYKFDKVHDEKRLKELYEQFFEMNAKAAELKKQEETQQPNMNNQNTNAVQNAPKPYSQVPITGTQA